MDDTFRRHWAIQVARERADEARELHRRSIDEEADRRPLEHSRWLGLQVRALHALVVVAEEGSFVNAARRLGYSRSTISHQIAQLERAPVCLIVDRAAVEIARLVGTLARDLDRPLPAEGVIHRATPSRVEPGTPPERPRCGLAPGSYRGDDRGD